MTRQTSATITVHGPPSRQPNGKQFPLKWPRFEYIGEQVRRHVGGSETFRAQDMRYRCGACGKIHKGMPDVSFAAPLDYYGIPQEERLDRAVLSREACVLDDERFFLRARLALPIRDTDSQFGWLVWCELPEVDFWTVWQTRSEAGATLDEPFEATLANSLPEFERSHGVEGLLTLGPDGGLPEFTILDDNHPLSVCQRAGLPPAQAMATAQSAGARLLIAMG